VPRLGRKAEGPLAPVPFATTSASEAADASGSACLVPKFPQLFIPWSADAWVAFGTPLRRSSMRCPHACEQPETGGK
jgi:hypothetical protein